MPFMLTLLFLLSYFNLISTIISKKNNKKNLQLFKVINLTILKSQDCCCTSTILNFYLLWFLLSSILFLSFYSLYISAASATTITSNNVNRKCWEDWNSMELPITWFIREIFLFCILTCLKFLIQNFIKIID